MPTWEHPRRRPAAAARRLVHAPTTSDTRTTGPRQRSRRVRRGLGTLAVIGTLVVGCGSAGTVSQARGDAPTIEPDPSEAEQLRDPGAALATSLLRAVASERGGNVAVSPVLALDGLSMVRAGAGGTTRDELDALLGTGDLDDDQLLASVAGTTAALEQSEGEQRSERRQGTVTVDGPSSIWLQRGTTLGDEWLDLLSSHLDRPVRLVDFRSDPDSARDAINRWAQDETGGDIDQLAPRGVVTSTSRLVLASTLWFEAPWDAPFEVERTEDGPFHLADGTTATVPLMQAQHAEGMLYAEGPRWQAVALPYLGRDLAMVVVVPQGSTLEELEAQLTGPALTDLLDDLRPAGVELSVPRFAFTSELDLFGPLRSLGLVQSTDVDEADLDRMAPAEPLAIDEVIQQTYISIDEEGSEQSAATVSETTTPPPPGLVSVAADQPFLFLVVHRPSDVVLLIGHVVDPRS